MNGRALAKPAIFAIGFFFSLGLFGTAFAGPVDFSKEKMVQPMEPVCDPKWYVSVGGGLDFDFQATNFVNGDTFDPFGGNGSFYEERLHGRSYNDVFDTSLYRIQIEVGRVLNPHMELFVLGKYAGGYGDTQHGDFDFEAPALNSGYELTTYFSDYRSWGAELGLRYFFLGKNEAMHVRPYVSISGGATYVESINATENVVYSPGSDYFIFRGKLYDDSVVGTAALMLGVEVPFSCHWSVGIEGGVRYEGTLDASDDFLQHNNWYGFPFQGLDKYNESAGDRLYCPLNVYAKVRF